MGLRVILAEAELELVPDEIRDHPVIRHQAQRERKAPGTLVLDQALHKQALQRLPDGSRRGRPDITQYCLQALLESPLNQGGNLEVAIHTCNNELIRVRGDTHIPRAGTRFRGIMSRVLAKGASHDREPLLWVEGRLSAQAVLERMAAGPVFRVSDTGRSATPLQLVDQAKKGDLTVVLGAFPKGGWGSEWRRAAPETVSLWREPINAWAIAAEIAAAYRFRHGPLGK